MSTRPSKPMDYEVIGLTHARYGGRDFYGEHASDMAELAYLRDWKRWGESKLQTLMRNHSADIAQYERPAPETPQRASNERHAALPALLREAERRVNQHVWGDRRSLVTIPADPNRDVDLLLMEAAAVLESLRAASETYTRRAIDCAHERASIKCPDCGIDFRGTLRPAQETPEQSSDGPCQESGGCPTEGAVLKRFWREHSPDVARFLYLTEDIADRVDRQRRNELLERMDVMSYSAACRDIDIAMSERAALKANASSPADLVGALQDVVHKDDGNVRPARAVKASETPATPWPGTSPNKGNPPDSRGRQ